MQGSRSSEEGKRGEGSGSGFWRLIFEREREERGWDVMMCCKMSSAVVPVNRRML